jgi:hypothetical protein
MYFYVLDDLLLVELNRKVMIYALNSKSVSSHVLESSSPPFFTSLVIFSRSIELPLNRVGKIPNQQNQINNPEFITDRVNST